MRLQKLVLVVALVASACGKGSSGDPAAPCVPDQACTPSSGAIACRSYLTACNASTGATTCLAGGTLADGATCGSANVCLAGACIAACVPGVTCSPATPGDPCKTYANACSEKLTVTSCAVGGNQVDGTACGSGLVCSAGACTATCTAGLACTPSTPADTCRTYVTTCSSTLTQAACTPAGVVADGTACNGTSVCQGGTCLGALAPPVLSPSSAASGTAGLRVTVTGPDPTALVYYTTNGTPPSDDPTTLSESFVGSGTLVLQSTAKVQAFAKLGTRRSATTIGLYTIAPPPPAPAGIALGAGFTANSVQLNGAASIVGTRLQLTPATPFLASSAFYPVALGVQGFTTDFAFQILDPEADGFTFTVQGLTPFAMGSQGGGLGYGPDPFYSQMALRIERSVAVKFDLYDNAGEGYNSTGLYTDGAVPTVPALDLTPSGILLHAGRVLDARIVYDGAVLTLTLTDKGVTPVATFTASFPIDIPAVIGSTTGFVGFTAATGEKTSLPQIVNWTFTNTK